MLKNKKVIVVMPAYNAARTLRKTYNEVMSQAIVDMVILIDDASDDETAAIAKTLPDTIYAQKVLAESTIFGSQIRVSDPG